MRRVFFCLFSRSLGFIYYFIHQQKVLIHHSCLWIPKRLIHGLVWDHCLVPKNFWLLPLGFSALRLRAGLRKGREETHGTAEQRILKSEHLSLLWSEMKPEIFNEGKFVQHRKQFQCKIETIILTWPFRIWPFYLLTTFKYNTEFEYLKWKVISTFEISTFSSENVKTGDFNFLGTFFTPIFTWKW